jgi:hypothetical protein
LLAAAAAVAAAVVARRGYAKATGLLESYVKEQAGVGAAKYAWQLQFCMHCCATALPCLPLRSLLLRWRKALVLGCAVSDALVCVSPEQQMATLHVALSECVACMCKQVVRTLLLHFGTYYGVKVDSTQCAAHHHGFVPVRLRM